VANPSVVIDIAAEYTGKKAFDKASKSTSKLEGTVASLAKKMAVAFSATAILKFTKDAVKAFAEDEKSAAILANTMKNLGLQFQNPAVETFIAKLSAATGEVDDNLRPAMQKLLQVTGSVSQSQELLTLALDVAAGSGVELNTVVSDLAAAQAGNTKGLKKYALGLTAAELKTIKFEDVTDKLGKTFAGSAAKGAETFSGQMKILSTAAGEAQETIGKGLVDAFKILAGTKTGIEPITKAMADLSQEVSDTIVGLALFIKKIKEIPIAGKGFSLIFENYIGILKRLRPELGLLIDAQQALSDMAKRQTAPFQLGMSVTGATDFYDSHARAIAKAEADALAKKLAADKKAAAAKIKTDKAAAANAAKLAKAAAVLDLQKIQIAAALKGKISEEEKTRLLLMQAIEEGNADKAEALAKKLEEIQEKNAKIAADLLAIGEAKDPFSTWAGSLSLAIAALAKLGLGMSAITSSMIPGVTYNPSQNPDRNYDDKVAAAEKAAADKAAADKIAADAAAVLAAAGDKAAADAAAAAAAAALAILGIPGTTFNPGQNPDRNYDDKAAAETAAAAALAASATNTSQSPINPNGTFGFSLPSYLQNSMPQSSSINIVIEGNVLDGDDFTNKVNDALLNANRQGLPRIAAGSLLELP
jgi:hypothetical protein